MPEISVIIPIYMVEATLRRCIDSVLNQTFSDYEVILVDDGSPDGCGDICDEYGERYENIRVIHKDNGGLSDARNAGLKRARGTYILFLDSDDHLVPWCLEALRRRDADLIMGSIMCAYDDGSVIPLTEREDELLSRGDLGEKLPGLLGERWLNYVHAKLYRREIIAEHKLRFEDDMLTSAEDTVFNFSFLPYCQTIYVCNQALHYYSQNTTGLGKRFYPDRYDRYTRLNDFIEKQCKSMSVYSDQMKKEVDKRRVLSAKWCVDGILYNDELSKKEKAALLRRICEDDYLQSIAGTVSINGSEELMYLLDHGERSLLTRQAANKLKGKIAGKLSLIKR